MKTLLLILLLTGFFNYPAKAQAEGKSSSSSGGGSGIALTAGIPHVYDLSYESLNRASHLTYAISAGYVPPITISIATVSVLSLDARARWHPFAGAFFLGVIGGYQSYSGSGSTTLSVSGQSIPITAKDTLSSMYVTPHFGWLWFFGKLIVGLEGGSQIGIGSKNTVSLTIADPTLQSFLTQVQSDPTYLAFESKIDKAVSKLSSFPYIGFKLGWRF